MILLCLLILLINFASGSDVIDCDSPNSCYGNSVDCDPNSDCHVVLQLDQQGDVDVHIRNIVDSNEYIALKINNQTDKINEYLICIPHQQKRFRAVSFEGEKIQITEQHMARYVQNQSNNNFVCSFIASELPPGFQNREIFVVSEGQFTDNLIIPRGYRLYKIDSDIVSIHQIASSSNQNDGVLSPNERKKTSDLLGKMQRISSQDDVDSDLESLLDKKSKDSDEGSDNFDEMLDSEKKFSTRRRQQKNKESERRRKEDSDQETENEEEDEIKPRRGNISKNGRPSRYEDNEDEDEDDDHSYKKKSKRPSRRYDFDDEDDMEDDEKIESNNKNGRGRRQKKDEYEDQDDNESFDDNDDYDNSSKAIKYIILLALIIIFFL